jgi:hypothetical protein
MKVRGWVQWIVVAVSSLAALALLGLCAFTFLYLRGQEQAAVAFAPPTVLITEPLSGVSAPAGGYLPVSATAFGSIPVARVELWVDGELKETQESDRPEGVSTFYAYFDLFMSEGPHLIFVHAVNTAGIIGRSLPVNFVGLPRPAPGQLLFAVRVGEGETLADIAQSYGTDPATLQELNPDLGGQEPAPGAMVKVPAPPKEVLPQPSPTPPPSAPGSAPVPIPNVPPLTEKKGFPLLDLVYPLVLFAGSTPPVTPTDLKGQVDGCEVILTWKDNATDETHYDVWMSLRMLMPQVVTTLQPSPGTGPAWVKFFAGQEGYLTFWVEAVNSKGKQPSNEITLLIPQNVGCATTVTDYLQVQVFDMTLQGNYDSVYCYASYEAAPETRIPASAGAFVQVKAGKADFSESAAGLNSRMVPVPKDGSLDIEGKCLGWSGQTLNELGHFGGRFTQDDWDGARRTLKSTSYEIEFAVKPYTVGVWSTLGVGTGMYGYEDPTLPAPYEVSMAQVYSAWAKIDPRERALSWKWVGDPKKIKGFAVFLDGIPYGYFDGANTRQATVYNPNYCGKRFRWQVRAVAGPTQSALSTPLDYDMPKCKTLATVRFDKFYLEQTRGSCGILDSHFWIAVNEQSRNFGGWSHCSAGPTIFDWLEKCNYGEVTQAWGIRCGEVTFKQLTQGFDVFTIPIDPNGVYLRIVSEFWEYDGGKLADLDVQLSYPSLEKAQEDLGCGKTFVSDFFWAARVKTRIVYTVAVYPNACADVP